MISRSSSSTSTILSTISSDPLHRLVSITPINPNISIPTHSIIQSNIYTVTAGFKEVKRGCCGTGRVETTVLLCNPMSVGTCSNATQYVFWDAVHPSEAANQILSDAIIVQGVSLVTSS